MPERPPKANDPYRLDPVFERAVVALCATRPNFWGRIGHAVDPDCLALEPAKRILRACRQIAAETGTGSQTATIVRQHQRRWLDEGKPDGNLALIKECDEFLLDALDGDLPSEDAAVASLKPTLARRIKDAAVREAIEAGGKDGDDFGRVVKLVDKANRLGEVEHVDQRALCLADVKAERVSWLWHGRIPFGKVTILEGDPGKGKSTAAIDIAARVTTGAPMPLDDERTDPAGVVLVSVEDGLGDTIKPRLLAAGGDAARVLVPFRDRVPCLLDSRDLDVIENAITQARAKLVVLDPLSALLGGIDAHKDADVRRAIAPLAQMAERTGVAIVLIRHLVKASAGTSALYAGVGSIGIIGAARSALLVATDPDNNDRRVLAAVKSNVAKLARSIRFEIEDVTNEEWMASRVVWLEECDLAADDLVGVRATRGNQLNENVEWLRGQLADGAQAAHDIEDAAREAGLSPKQLRGARAKLGVVTTRYGRPGHHNVGWRLELPEKVAGEPADVIPIASARDDPGFVPDDYKPEGTKPDPFSHEDMMKDPDYSRAYLELKNAPIKSSYWARGLRAAGMPEDEIAGRIEELKRDGHIKVDVDDYDPKAPS